MLCTKFYVMRRARSTHGLVPYWWFATFITTPCLMSRGCRPPSPRSSLDWVSFGVPHPPLPNFLRVVVHTQRGTVLMSLVKLPVLLVRLPRARLC